ncbi:MAG: S8 family serine peptidase [Bacteroidales bacterium]|nr:S8 family serine peptidase [Bacteroidales bacterium]
MKKVFSLLVGLLLCANAFSQEVCWVFFTDKANTTFDPYSYFDAKAIERYRLNHADLYDSTNFPLNAQYCESVANLSDEVVGESRWLNAMAVVADENAITKIQRLPFVKKLVIIQSDMNLCSREEVEETMESGMAEAEKLLSAPAEPYSLHAQLKRTGGEEFVKAGLRGKGIRIAVLDGGFPLVDKHAAFRHLRDNGRILKTYNFPKKQENVYGWNSHGTMTLSCIAGKDVINKCDIGLATEAEFLLARTEVGPEPKKEEVWWVMGLEWADKNGAQLISSSLGYGNINHWPSETDGTSPISKAANIAVEKGILICNSAGNEGTKRSWPGIILPADAENVLTVGGINPSTQQHQDFSSYGPTADGRLKPNVVAYASECRAANPKGMEEYSNVAGTSFSCPLVAGFAACAWQGHPEYTALQLKAEIEKSGDVYPYYDYAIGYGVPQAAYFTGNQVKAEKLFDIVENEEGLYIQVNDNYRQGDMLYYHIRKNNGRLLYRHEQFNYGFEGRIYPLQYHLPLQKGLTLCVHYKGFTESYTIKYDHSVLVKGNVGEKIMTQAYQHTTKVSNPGQASQWGSHAKNKLGVYFGFGALIPTVKRDFAASYPFSMGSEIGIYYLRNVTKIYGWGLSLEEDVNNVQYKLEFPPAINNLKESSIETNRLNLEFYQHLRLGSGYNGLGCSLEIGAFGSWIINQRLYYTYEPKEEGDMYSSNHKLNHNNFDWGLNLRVNYGPLGIYAKVYSSIFENRQFELMTPIPYNNEHRLAEDHNLEIGLMMKF